MTPKEIFGPKAIGDVRRGLYEIQKIQPLIDLAEKMGEPMDETIMRFEHLRKQLEALHAFMEPDGTPK